MCTSMHFRNQGAILSHVVPEILLDYADYLEWYKKINFSSVPFKEEMEFKSAAVQGWTCVLMQVVKVSC